MSVPLWTPSDLPTSNPGNSLQCRHFAHGQGLIVPSGNTSTSKPEPPTIVGENLSNLARDGHDRVRAEPAGSAFHGEDPLATRKRASAAPKAQPDFDPEAYLKSVGVGRTVAEYRRDAVVFSQGDPANDVRYIQKGTIKLSVLSRIGKEAVVALLGVGDFFGEGALTGQLVRMMTATAMSASSVLVIEKETMVHLLHEESGFSDRFISYMLTRNLRVEADLIDQLFNSSEKRLARTLLLLARYGQASPDRKLPKISQELLAEMVGTTRSRVNFFMNKFKKLGFIEYNGGLKVNSSLLSVVLHD